jgi:hypothetical protein
MAKVESEEQWGPFYDTYTKEGAGGLMYQQEQPAYREVSTPFGVFGVQPGEVLYFEQDAEGVPQPVRTKVDVEIGPAIRIGGGDQIESVEWEEGPAASVTKVAKVAGAGAKKKGFGKRGG